METAVCACGHSHASEVAGVCQRVRVHSHASREKAWDVFSTSFSGMEIFSSLSGGVSQK